MDADRQAPRPGHSSGIFSAGSGNGAIYETARIVDAFRREVREPNLTFNVGLIGGGDGATLDAGRVRIAATGKTNIIASTAIARGDLRACHPTRSPAPRRRCEAIVAQSLPGAKRDHRIPPRRLSADGADRRQPRLVRRLQGANRDLGLPAMGELDPVKRGAGDVSFVAADVDALAGLGA